MFKKSRELRGPEGQRWLLKSERSYAREPLPGYWIISLELREQRKRGWGSKRIAIRELRRSHDWPSGAIVLLQAQEELMILREHGLNLTIVELMAR